MPCKKYERNSGVYRLRNTVNGNFYIGSTKHLGKRRGRHFYVLKNGLKENIRMLEDAKKYGADSFCFEVIEYCDEDKLLEREQHYFELLMPQYNVWKSIYDGTGRTYTNAQLKYFKTLNKGPRNLPEHSNSLKKAWVKRREKYSKEELSKKMAEARRGILHSEETKKMMSERRKGKHKSEETKEKMRLAKLGTKLINGKYVKREVANVL